MLPRYLRWPRLTLLVSAAALPAVTRAQLPALPLATGNAWTYDYALGQTRTPGRLRLSVYGPVRVPPLPADTSFAAKDGWNALFGTTGETYYKVAVDGYLPLFPLLRVDTLLVRSDGAGNVWARGFAYRGRPTVLKAADQLWFTTDVTPSYPYVLEAGVGFGPGDTSMEYAVQMEWEGPPIEGGWSFWPEDGHLPPGLHQFPPLVLGHARRLVPDLSAAGPWRLLGFAGGLWGVADAPFAFFVIPRLGLVYIPIWSDQTELQGGHYELVQAWVDGRQLELDHVTAVPARAWGCIKDEAR